MENKQIALIGGVILFLIIISLFLFQINKKDEKQDLNFDFKPIASSSPIETVKELRIEDLVEGTGEEQVQAGDTITVNYTGTFLDGNIFDQGNFSTEIGVGKVIKGWDQGLLGMKIGGKRKLTIPPNLGYGDRQAGSIPPNSVLVFEVDLLKIEKPESSPSASPSASPNESETP